MTGATLLIKRMPPELQLWLAGEPERNHCSMNKEALRLLEEARTLREVVSQIEVRLTTLSNWSATCT